MTIQIGGKNIGYGQPPFIIAEAGVNHNGKLPLALRLIDAAARSGADAVKFQTYRPKQVVTATGQMAEYQKKNTGKSESQLAMIKRFALPERFYGALRKRCRQKNILFLSTPHGSFDSVRFLETLNMPAYKFGSGDLTNIPLLEFTAKLNKPMIISTGMGTLTEIRDAIRAVKRAGNQKIVALHCTTNYPCPPEEVNLRSMQTMMRVLNVPIGYSDHTEGIEASVAAVTLGACLIEKHFTLDRDMPGPDQRTSLEPADLKEFVRRIRLLPVLLGSAEKKPQASERRIAPLVRRSVVATRRIEAGERFTKNNLDLKRPGTGLPPVYYTKILGRRARRTVSPDAQIHRADYA